MDGKSHFHSWETEYFVEQTAMLTRIEMRILTAQYPVFPHILC